MIASNCTRPETEFVEETAVTAGGESATDRPPGTRYSYLIALLGRLEGQVTIDRVTDAVHEWEHEHTESASDRTWFDIHEELYLVDLPVLDRAGIVSFDTGRGIVSKSE
ncbi:DUF7344 domain-containing protein [Haloglomus halophilum]|uniref:DUF7344 domain-containing protein n=1 Tax=Haloglomus halophilum TaxID=2962672 RepID=UPI0020C98327|nr:hypothetical protein [Haloglomus halophilum]